MAPQLSSHVSTHLIVRTLMRTSFHIASTGPLLTVKQRISHLSPVHGLLKLPRRTALLATYKHFFRLRHLVLDKPYQEQQYVQLLRRRFSRGDFNLRRNKVLGVSEFLSHEDLIRRIAATYTFVFNATCNVTDKPPPVKTYDDLKVANKPRLETSVLQTILKMEEGASPKLLHDFEYTWYDKACEREKELCLGTIDASRAKELNRTREVVDIGYADYERTVMALNESLGLCL